MSADRERPDILRSIAFAAPSAIAYVDKDERFAFSNAQFQRHFGRAPADIEGAPVREILGDEQYQVFAPFLRRALRGERVSFETEVKGSGERSIWVRATYVPDLDGSHAVRGFAAFAEDITERKRVEAGRRFASEVGRLFASSLELSDTLDRATALAVPDYADLCLIELLDPTGGFTEISAVAALDEAKRLACKARPERWRRRRDAGAGAVWAGETQLVARVDDLIRRELAESGSFLSELVAGGARSFAIAPLLLRDRAVGALTFVSWTRDLDGQDAFIAEELARGAAIAIDNARLFAAERVARRRIGRLQEVTAAFSRAETSHDVIQTACRIGAEAMEAYGGTVWLASGDGGLRLAGSWGTPRESLERYSTLTVDSGAPAIDVLTAGEAIWVETEEDYRARSPAIFELTKRTGRLSSYCALPLTIAEKVGGVIVFAHALGHVYDSDDRAFYFTLAHHCSQALDRARLLDHSREAAAEAERASRAKDEFLAMLGHELRNPLSPILTALHLLKMGVGASGDRERQHAVIERQMRHLGRLVDDLLDVSRIAAGRVKLELAAVAVNDVVARAVDLSRPLLDDRRHTLTVEVSEQELRLFADPIRLAQVFSNLLINAAKYTPPGGRISIAAAEEAGEIAVRVTDDGAGIPHDLLPQVFELFAQGPQPIDRPQGGLGLGLAIVRSLVLLHGGSVEARSDGPGTGSEFTVRLPAISGDAASTLAAPVASAARLPRSDRGRVLIVDDNEDSTEMLALWLGGEGFDVRTAEDAPSALAVAALFQPSVAVLDLGLPGIDGFELARRLRRSQGLSGLRMIALTGYGHESDRERTRAAGFEEHLVKPTDPQKLVNVIAAMCEGEG